MELGREVAGALGTDALRSVIIPHPLGGLDPQILAERSRHALNDLVESFTATPVENSTASGESTARTLDLSGSWEEINDYFYAQRWTDGLPIVPPTAVNVERVLASVARPADALLGFIPPKMGAATLEKVVGSPGTELEFAL